MYFSFITGFLETLKALEKHQITHPRSDNFTITLNLKLRNSDQCKIY